jgi:glycosyltransferase involved in cell wall biosynthesis
VLPSSREGAPRTLIEAAAMARPLIATDVPGCRAVVDRDVSGYFCDVKSAESLSDAMKRFLALSPAAQRAMGAAGRTKMEREYDQRLVVEAYREALDLVIARRRGSC